MRNYIKPSIIFLFIGITMFCFSCKVREKPLKKNIVLRWSANSYPIYDKFRASESKEFEEIHPEVIVKFEPISGISGASGDKLMMQIAGNTAPDIFYIPTPQPLDYIKRDVLLDLTTYMEKDRDFLDEIYPEILNICKYNERLYALPNNANTDALFYNKKLFRESGIPFPDNNWTWQNALEAAIKLTKKDRYGKVLQYGLLCPPYVLWLPALIYQNGGDIWNRDKTRCIIKSKESEDALCFFRDLSGKYHVSPTFWETKEQGGVEMFASNRVAMMVGAKWIDAAFEIKKTGELEYGVAPVPMGKNGRRISRLLFNALGIWNKTKHPDMAYEFVKFMIRPDGVKFLIQVGDSMPIRKSGKEVEYFLSLRKENQVFLDAIRYSFTEDRIAHPEIPYAEVHEILKQNFERYLLGDISPGESLQKTEDTLNEILQNRINNIK